ncbi:serine/threonine-protein kinase pim-2-like isoform X2 [Bolinopsis microptera]|uniref:serine/threonine-protein kinase pim-2-like isoform X2 n=1 Tax=Bolinopsis microptera TaxID=2820187 RepID=UPI003078C3DE
MFLDDFEPLYEISSTDLHQMYLAKRYVTGKEVIVKVLEGKSREYSKQKDIMVPNEILINKKLNNPAIFQKWEEFFFESGVWFMVFEAAQGVCTLSDYIAEHGALSETQAREIMRQLYNILIFCHLKDVDPRNLCPNNILIQPDTLKIKLSNFEEASLTLKSSKPHITEISDPAYLPPEYFLTGKHLPLHGSVWSLGCILFEMVFARRPLFVTASDFQQLENLFSKVSTNCIRFLKGCLCPVSRKRLEFQEVKRHVWFSGEISM